MTLNRHSRSRSASDLDLDLNSNMTVEKKTQMFSMAFSSCTLHRGNLCCRLCMSYPIAETEIPFNGHSTSDTVS